MRTISLTRMVKNDAWNICSWLLLFICLYDAHENDDNDLYAMPCKMLLFIISAYNTLDAFASWLCNCTWTIAAVISMSKIDSIWISVCRLQGVHIFILYIIRNAHTPRFHSHIRILVRDILKAAMWHSSVWYVSFAQTNSNNDNKTKSNNIGSHVNRCMHVVIIKYIME